MKLVADDAILLVDDYFADDFEIQTLPTAAITPDAICDADVLLIRSTLAVNEALLKNTAVKCVATTTSGHDHIDTAYCEANQIAWYHAPGCNAISVAEYVLCVIAALRKQGLLTRPKKAAVIGVGHVGREVATRLSGIGFEVLLNDPPRAARCPDFSGVPLSEIQDCDLICCHTPLTEAGEFATKGLIDETFLAQQKPGCIILNAGRGGVVKTAAMTSHGQHCEYVFDVFENEPNISPEVVSQCLLATPHIAGHAIEGKWRGTQMAYQAIARLFNLNPNITVPTPIEKPKLNIDKRMAWEAIALEIYNPLRDHQWLLSQIQKNDFSKEFTAYRKQYPVRHEFP